MKKIANDYTFIVDPIDGTTNFSWSLNFSSISVALLKDGEPVIGVCYNPYLDEMFTAIKSNGAYLNDKLIHTSDRNSKTDILLYGTSAYYPKLRSISSEIQSQLSNLISDYRNFGSAVLEICHIAYGRAEAYFSLKFQSWDFAASPLILKEAGGVITNIKVKDIDYTKSLSILVTNNKEYYNVIEINI